MKWAFSCLAVALCGWFCVATRAARPDVSESFPSNEGSSAAPRWLGAASCSAAACHGDSGAKVGKRGEHTIWIERDGHARAYSVLFNDRSQLIARNLRLKQPTHESSTCLVCHASSPTNDQRGDRFQASDGVSCESCHGPAEKWLAEHYQPGWTTKSNAEKQALGFLPTKKLLARAQSCVACHVGHDDADVNHDLLAAGHPPLQFEFSSYQAAMPRHWDVRDDKARYPDLEARSWLLGQNVTTAAALELLAHRATKDKGSAWPELAEFDCRSCHHDLTGFLPMAAVAKTQNHSGPLLRWNQWHSVVSRHAFYWPDGDRRVGGSFRGILAVHLEMRRSPPDSDRVANAARPMARRLIQYARMIDGNDPMFPDALRVRFEYLAKDEIDVRDSPDAARQRYLGLRAFYETMDDRYPSRLDAGWKPKLEKLKAEVDVTMSSSYWQQALPESQRKR